VRRDVSLNGLVRGTIEMTGGKVVSAEWQRVRLSMSQGYS